MQIEIKEIDGDVQISGNVITLNNGKITLTDGTIICSGHHYIENQPTTENNGQPFIHEEYQLDTFNSITSNSYFNVEVAIGDKQQVIVDAPQDVIESINVECKGLTLELDIKPTFDIEVSEIKARVVVQRLNQLISMGGSKIKVLTPIKSDGTLMIAAHQGSKITTKKIYCPNVYLTSSEASSINVEELEAPTAIITKSIQASHVTIGAGAKTPNLYITSTDSTSTTFNNINVQHIVVKSNGSSNNIFSGTAETIEFTASQRSSIDAKLLSAETGIATSKDIANIQTNVSGKLEKHSSLLAKLKNI
ncbi:MAG: DUF2807 domain-containing protein [Bacteroidales bacterium]|nr:DUF2807 domain-containing protein [Bacteroidales bacterium]